MSKLFGQQFDGNLVPQYSATSQLIWRDYFYIMSFDNKNFDQIEKNPACLKISWNSVENEKHKNMLECWKYGKTGYPFIDAGMRQLLQVYIIYEHENTSVRTYNTEKSKLGNLTQKNILT